MVAIAKPVGAKRSDHPSLVPSQLYRTRDGWLFLVCSKEKFWGEFARAVERPEWADDPRFKTFPDRLRHRDWLTQEIDKVLSVCTTAEWLAIFAGRVLAAPVNDVPRPWTVNSSANKAIFNTSPIRAAPIFAWFARRSYVRARNRRPVLGRSLAPIRSMCCAKPDFPTPRSSACGRPR